jgi:cob(I)alamin adenosyltransferase
MKLEKGLVHVYTGDGRGKTSAALLVALRAAQAGYKVLTIQFLKQAVTSERTAFQERFPEVEWLTLGEGFYKILHDRKPEATHRESAQRAWRLAQEKINSGKYDVVVLDELNLAINFGFVNLGEVLELIRRRPKHVEILITGRHAPQKLIRMADYVSEMKKIKHPYDQGILARKGIDF